MLGSIRDAFVEADLVFVALAVGVYAISVPLVAWRWRTVVAGVTGHRAALRPLILASLASSFVNNVTPTVRLGGEACRVIALVRLRIATVSRATVAIAYERLSEAPAIFAIAVVTLLVVGRMSIHASALAIAMMAVGCIGAALVAPRVWRQLSNRWPIGAIAIAPSTMAAAASMSGLVWLLDVVRLRLAAAAFHADIGLAQAATLTAITIVAGLVPTVGGFGVIEGGLVAGLIALGVRPAEAVGIAAVERSISYGLATVSGFGALSVLGGRSLWNAVRLGVPPPDGAAA